MSKKVDCKVMSGKVCRTPGCDRKIKQNILDRKPSATLCYRCFQDKERGRGHGMISGRELRNAKKPQGGNIERPEFLKTQRGGKRTIQ